MHVGGHVSQIRERVDAQMLACRREAEQHRRDDDDDVTAAARLTDLVLILTRFTGEVFPD